MNENSDLHSAAKGTEKNVLAVSVVAYHLVAFDSRSYWRCNMSSTATLSGGIASFRPLNYC